MLNKPSKPRRPGSETGLVPRVDVEPDSQHEPPQPTLIPEFDEGSITGIIPITTEGEDEAKNADDSATKPDSYQPTVKR